MYNNLITAWEVIQKAPSSDKFPPHFVAGQIPLQEKLLKVEVLGKDLYDAMLASRIDYGDLLEWSNGTTYPADSFVIFGGKVWTNAAESTGERPCDLGWTLARKFESDCFETFWNEHLWDYLANIILAMSIIPATYKIDEQGVTEWVDEQAGKRTGSSSVVTSTQNYIHALAQQHLKLLRLYMSDTTCLSSYFSTERCEPSRKPVTRSGRRIFFKQ